MLQPDANLPAVPPGPAPWDLRGSGGIVALRLPRGSPAREAFLPDMRAGRGRTYYYAPEARGRVRPGRLVSRRFDARLFPDLADARVLAVLGVESFRTTFPVARIV